MALEQRSCASATPADYYEHCREDVIPLLPASVDSLLDVGCGTGRTAANIRRLKGCRWIGGVEQNLQAAKEARDRLDYLASGDIEFLSLPIPPSSLDAILCLDVLEHLRDPWAVVRNLGQFLKPGGALIVSVPNVSYYKVSFPLFFAGRFQYASSGVLDRTHLRFFVKDTAVQLVEGAGLFVDTVRPVRAGSIRGRLINGLTLGTLHRFLEVQYLIRGVRKG